MTYGSSHLHHFRFYANLHEYKVVVVAAVAPPIHSGMAWAQSLVVMYINTDGLHPITSRLRVFSFAVI